MSLTILSQLGRGQPTPTRATPKGSLLLRYAV
jgi:hypothetical protein